MSTFQPKRCRAGFKFCSNWPQRAQYKGCIPKSKECYNKPKLYELQYESLSDYKAAESCTPNGTGNVCPYSNHDWARLLNGFTVVTSAPLEANSVFSQLSLDARLNKKAKTHAFKQKLRCMPLNLRWSGKRTARGSIENLTYVWTKFIAKGGAGHIHLFSEENGTAPDVIVKLLVNDADMCSSSRQAVSLTDDAKETEDVWGPKLVQENCPHIVLQRCITQEGGYSCTGNSCKLVIMEYMSNDVAQLLENDSVQKLLSQSIRDDIIWKTFQALKCIWKNNGVYPDLKAENVMIRCMAPSGQVRCVDEYATSPASIPVENAVDFDNLIVKLIDLDSICFFSGSPPRRADIEPSYIGGDMASYLPPYAWAPSAVNWGYCNQVTNIWNMAMFAMLVLCPTAAAYNEFTAMLWARAYRLCEPHFNTKLNDLFYAARSLIQNAQKTSQLNLSNLEECFAPNPCNLDDWRRCSALKNNCTTSHDPPFLFENMFSRQ